MVGITTDRKQLMKFVKVIVTSMSSPLQELLMWNTRVLDGIDADFNRDVVKTFLQKCRLTNLSWYV